MIKTLKLKSLAILSSSLSKLIIIRGKCCHWLHLQAAFKMCFQYQHIGALACFFGRLILSNKFLKFFYSEGKITRECVCFAWISKTEISDFEDLQKTFSERVTSFMDLYQDSGLQITVPTMRPDIGFPGLKQGNSQNRG